MKNLLSILVTMSLTTSIITPLVNQTNITQKNQELNSVYAPLSSVNFWFGKQGTEREYVNDYSADLWGHQDIFAFWLTYELDQGNVEDYHYFSAIDPNHTSFSKTSWGDTSYQGDKFSDFEMYRLDNFIHRNIKVATDVNSIYKYANVNLLNIRDSAGLAHIVSNHKFGMSYYSENNKNYLQFFGCQSIIVDTSMSGGRMWTNLGQGFKLIR